MAEESISLPGSPDIIKKDANTWRRNSTGKPLLLNTKEKVIPIYLRASTGSCHDFCKYGKRHALEEKTRQLTSKRISTKMPGDKVVIPHLESPLRKRLPSVKIKSSCHPNSGKLAKDTADVIKCEVRKSPGSTAGIIKLEVLTQKLSDGQNSANNKNFVDKMKKKVSPVSESEPFNVSKLRKQRVPAPSFTRIEVSSSARNSSKAKDANVHTKNAATSRPKSVAEKLSLSSHPSSRRENDSETRKKIGISRADSRKSIKHLRASISPKAFTNRSGSLNVRKPCSSKALPPSKNQEVKTAKAEKSENDIKLESGDAVQEKTLYVIKMERENKVLESDQNERCVVESSSLESSSSSANPSSSIPLPESPSHSEENQEESECTVTEAEDSSLECQEKSESTVTEAEDESSENQEKSDFTGTEAEDSDESLSECSETKKGEKKPTQRKDGAFSSEDKEGKSVKLHFKRGKVVDPQFEDNGSPRRLKFRRGRVLGENQIMKSDGRTSFKRRGADVSAEVSKPGSGKIALRHQDVQGKKDSRGLFNNVIEETANKLVETRKSKVKALVGAFETVISLQEKKPSANNNPA